MRAIFVRIDSFSFWFLSLLFYFLFERLLLDDEYVSLSFIPFYFRRYCTLHLWFEPMSIFGLITKQWTENAIAWKENYCFRISFLLQCCSHSFVLCLIRLRYPLIGSNNNPSACWEIYMAKALLLLFTIKPKHMKGSTALIFFGSVHFMAFSLIRYLMLKMIPPRHLFVFGWKTIASL